MKATDIHSGLTAERVREVLDYEPETGILTWKAPLKFSSRKAGTVAGSKNDQGYVTIKVDNVLYRAHRLAWLYMHGEWPDNEVDHRNGIRDDNRMANLRDVSCQVNSQNQLRAKRLAVPSPFSTGLLGTYFNRRRQLFIARIQDPVTRKQKNLGAYATAAEAHEIYIKEKRKIHAGNTL